MILSWGFYIYTISSDTYCHTGMSSERWDSCLVVEFLKDDVVNAYSAVYCIFNKSLVSLQFFILGYKIPWFKVYTRVQPTTAYGSNLASYIS